MSINYIVLSAEDIMRLARGEEIMITNAYQDLEHVIVSEKTFYDEHRKSALTNA